LVQRKIVQVTRVFGGGKTTIPSDVRKMLGIRDGDTVVWYVNERGEVCIRKG